MAAGLLVLMRFGILERCRSRSDVFFGVNFAFYCGR